jgi:BMFP domain-containing protein YqiC
VNDPLQIGAIGVAVVAACGGVVAALLSRRTKAETEESVLHSAAERDNLNISAAAMVSKFLREELNEAHKDVERLKKVIATYEDDLEIQQRMIRKCRRGLEIARERIAALEIKLARSENHHLPTELGERGDAN